MKARYRGVSFGADGLTDGRVYEILRVDRDTGALAVIDDSGDDYLYSPVRPRPAAIPNHPGGRWEIVEDDEGQTLRKALEQ